MSRFIFLRVLMAGALIAACTSTEGPVEPAWGKQPCAHCAMVLSEHGFGAQLVSSDGERFFFDDPGCMVLFVEERRLASARAWVYDDGAGRWTDAHTARYTRGAGTPMDFGFAATSTGALGWNELRTEVLAKQRGAR